MPLLGATIAFLGTVLLASRYLGTLELVSVPGRFTAMQDSTALGFVLAGLAVFCHELVSRRLALLFGALAVGLGSLVLAEQVAGRPFALLDLLLLREATGLRMSPATACGFALAGAVALVHGIPGTRQGWRAGVGLALAGSIVAVGCVGLMAHEPTGGLARLARMELHTALAFLGLGAAFFLMVGRLRGAALGARMPAWMPWLAGGGVALLVVGIWVDLTADGERGRRLLALREQSAVGERVRDRITGQLLALGVATRMVERAGDGILELAIDGLADQSQGVEAAVRLGASGAVMATHVRDGGRAEGLGVPGAVEAELARPEIAELLARGAEGNRLTASAPFALGPGQRRIAVRAPLLVSGGSLVVLLDSEELGAGLVGPSLGLTHGLQLLDGDEPLYRASGAEVPGEGGLFEQPLAFCDRIWRLQGRSAASGLPGVTTAGNTLTLWIGLFLAFSIAFAVRKSEQLRQRAASLEQAKRTIEEHAASLAQANASLEERAASLHATEERLRRAAREKRRVLDSLSAFLVAVDGEGVITEWNFVSSQVFGLRGSEVLGKRFDDVPLPWDRDGLREALAECLSDGQRVVREGVRVGTDGRVVSLTINPTMDGARRGFALIGSDVTERQRLEVQLHAAQKLESVGTLAAGIAHEINTPMQFVGDNVRFVSGALSPLTGLLELAPELRASALEGGVRADLADRMDDLLAGVDAGFVVQELPLALEETLEGIERVTTIVRAMKEFSHPGGEGVAAADVNAAILTTLQVARNEYKYVADVVTDLGELPPVECWIADLNQVFLNLLVNGTHAIRERLGEGSSERGRLTVTSRRDGEQVELRFSDTGAGIPEQVRSRIFDQFFTTKGIGRGTGLGLSICRSVVVGKHGGTLAFETEPGAGTTFIVRLPIHQEAAVDAAHADEPALCR